MEQRKNTQPPRWATRLLSWYCRPELLEDLQGDLNEYFVRNLKTKGWRNARFIYVIDVLKFLRLYTLRKPEFLNLLIHWIMLGSYIKTSGRSIVRNKLFSAINIIGLAISMSVGLLLISVIVDISEYDRFHKNSARIFRVQSQYEYLGNKDRNIMATTSMLAAREIKEFTGLDKTAILRRGFAGDVGVGDKRVPLSGYWANADLFQVFTFPFIEGDPATALASPYSVVLTATAAHKIFGSESALGKSVIFNKDKTYTVTGILQEIPRFSHMRFEMLASLATRDITERENKDEMAWDNIWSTWVYVLLPPGANLTTFKENLNILSTKQDPTVRNTHVELVLQPLDKIMTTDNVGNEIGPTMGSTLLWVLSGLTFIVLLSACFNYTNLSMARSLRRSREVGIRKVIGAFPHHVAFQFVVESVLIALLSLAAAFVLFLLERPHFISMERGLQELLVLELSPTLIVWFIAFAVFIGIAAGIVPALFFSRINAIQVLKNISSIQIFRQLSIRKILIVFQYAISVMLITGALIMFQQYKHFLAFDLGFDTESILNIRLQGNKANQLKKELLEMPEVKGVSQSVIVTSVGNYYGTNMKNPGNPQDSVGVYFNIVDENYIPLHNHQLLAGRNFTAKPDSAVESEVIVNEEVLRRFNIAANNPAEAIGTPLRVDGKELLIIGVMRDFKYGKANDKSDTRTILRYSNTEVDFLNVKLTTSDLPGAHAKIQAIWKRMDPVHPFEAKFYDEALEESFSELSASVKIAGTTAFLAICIASIGLFGMVVFTTETRLKEMSIRKILGASEGNLIVLLGRGFLILLGVASFIALPSTYLLFDRVMLQEFANPAPLRWMEGFISITFVMSIAIVMIGSLAFNAIRSNPVDVIKSE